MGKKTKQFSSGDRIEIVKDPGCLSIGTQGTLGEIKRFKKNVGATYFVDVVWDDGRIGYLTDAFLKVSCKKA